MKTSQKQTSLFTEDQLTYSQADSHANHIRQQENDLGKRTSAISGLKCSEQFKRLTQPTLWAKMFVDLLIGTGEWSSKKCALTWKLVGTKYNRYYCQLVPSVRHIEETEFGSLLPTPQASDFVTTVQNNNFSLRHLEHNSGWVKNKGLLPTPTTFDYNTPRKEETFLKAKERHLKKGVNLQNPLKQMAAMGMLPTPMVADWKGSSKKRKGNTQLTETLGVSSQLNPRFVAEMMGFPPNWTELPFQNGEQKASKDMEMQ